MKRGQVPVEVRPTIAPDGDRMVLLQLPDGFILTTASDARRVATLLVDAANEIETARCSCGNEFDGDNFCMPSACQWEV